MSPMAKVSGYSIMRSISRKSRQMTPSSPLRRLYQRDQRLAIMLELGVADAGDAAELVQGGGANRGDAVDGGVVQHDISRHAALARHLGTPGAQRRHQRRIAGALRRGREVAAQRFYADGAVA